MVQRTRTFSSAGQGFWIFASLIGASFFFLLALTWQSVRTARSNVEIVESVLNDYAELAVEQYALHLRQYFGYWWSYQFGLRVSEQFEAQLFEPERQFDIGEDAPPPLQAAADALGAIFLIDGNSRTLSVLQGNLVVDRARLLRIVDENPNPDRFVVRHLEIENSRNVLSVFYPVPGRDDWYGITYQPAAVARQFLYVFENWPLLPEALANDLENNEGIRIQIEMPSGKPVFDSVPGPFDDAVISAPTARHQMADDYQGLFSGFQLTASLDPMMADRLIIGGLPRSRLPALLTLMVLTQIVLVAIFWVLYKERAIARMRSEFVARVSHEFRTPLTQIRMFAETMILGRERSPEDRIRQLGIINREAKRLGHMVTNVLTLAGMERRGFNIENHAHPVCEILAQILDEYSVMLAHSPTTIELVGCGDHSGELRARLDSESFTQVITNLLDNACKYGPEEQTIRIEVRPADKRCLIIIDDEGPGIPERERDRIWELYYRLDRESEQGVNGTGIGLPIALELIAAMNGDCRVETAPSGGARFIISLERMPP